MADKINPNDVDDNLSNSSSEVSDNVKFDIILAKKKPNKLENIEMLLTGTINMLADQPRFRSFSDDGKNKNDDNKSRKISKDSEKIYKTRKEVNKIKEQIFREAQLFEDIEVRIIRSEMPFSYKVKAIQILQKASGANIDNGNMRNSNDYQRAYKFVNDLLSIPWNIYSEMGIAASDESKDIRNFIIEKVKKLEQHIYGLRKVKGELIEFIAEIIKNPQKTHEVIGLWGEPGIGKTLIGELFAKCINKRFFRINMAGLKDASILKGHERTYVDSTYGQIAQALIDTKTMDPLIFIDEVDKPPQQHEQEIFGILTHLLDPETNKEWRDDYFREFPFDLSRVTWILSYNDPTNLHAVAAGSRIRAIHVASPQLEEKIIIAEKYILPQFLDKFGFQNDDIIIPRDVLHYIIVKHTTPEAGLRNIKRTIKGIVRKINLIQLIGYDNVNLKQISENTQNSLTILDSVLEYDWKTKFTFPIKLTIPLVDELLRNFKENDNFTLPQNVSDMYV